MPALNALNALEGFDIVCVSVMDWDHPFASSRHHLMRALAAKNRVLFVDNQSNPLTALRHQRAKAKAWLGLAPNPREVEPNLWVYAPPPVVPMGKIAHPGLFDAAYALNQATLKKGVQRACRALGMDRPLLWISFNVLSSESLIGALNERLVVYHCTDEITAMAHNSPFIGAIERRLLSKADLTFCSSRQLAADKGPLTRRCHFVPNGADVALFEEARHPATAVHPALADLEGPVLGFAGHMEERFDFDLVASVADARPGWTIALAGPVAASRQDAAARLATRPNVRMVGLLPRPALPAFLKGCAVAMIPFVHSKQTRAIYPLKLNEYMAAGTPVALTPFADLREFDGHVHAGDGPEGFLAACEAALADTCPERSAQRLAIGRANAWDGRAAEMGGLVLEALASASAPDARMGASAA